jgi:Fe-S-cluster containining protein
MRNKLRRLATSLLHKLRRLATSLLPVAENRRGSCNRCGECCKLPFPCPFLRFDAEGLSTCSVYHLRPPSCRKYPRTADEHLTQEVCGFWFEPATASATVPTRIDPNPASESA